MIMDTYNTGDTLSSYADIGVRVDGSDVGVYKIVTGDVSQKASVALGTKGVSKSVEVMNGLQSMQSGVRKGEWVTGVWLNGDTYTASTPTTTPRIMFYGDSMLGGQAATNPSLQGAGQLVRNTYAATGSVILEAWGSRKLKDDCPDTGSAQTFAELIATVSPTIFYSAIGYNDLGNWTAAAFETALGDFVERLNTELPGIAIYLQGPLVQATDTGLPDFRTACSNVATAHSGYCTYVDATDAAFPQGVNVHPNTAEQAQWATAIEGILGL